MISCITDGAIIKHNLTVTWDTTVGGARKQLTNANDTLTVKYVNKNREYLFKNLITQKIIFNARERVKSKAEKFRYACYI